MAKADYVTNAICVLITAASAKPSTNPVRAAHPELLARLAGRPPRPIPLNPHVVDLEDRADGRDKVSTRCGFIRPQTSTTSYRTSPVALIATKLTPSFPTSRPT